MADPRPNRLSRRDFLKIGGATLFGAGGLVVKNELDKVGNVLKFGESLSLPTDPITPGRVLEWIRPVSVKAGPGTIAGMAVDAYAYIHEGKEELKLKDCKATGVGIAFDTLTGCTPKPEGTPPTAEQITTVTAQATALPTELNPISATSTPPALESVPAPTEPVTEFPSVIEGLYIGEVTPGNIVGMIPGWENTGVNTIYNPSDATQVFATANGTIEAIPPRAFGIDQNQLINYFHAQETEGGVMMGDYQGMSLTLQNGIWKAATGETFIPFIKAEPNSDAVYLVMDANGGIQIVDIAGNAIGAPTPMFETPQSIATRMGFEKADQVVDVEMNKNGSLSFITEESRATEKDPNRMVQIVNEVSFIGEPEKLGENGQIVQSITSMIEKLAAVGVSIGREEAVQNLVTIRREGLDLNDKTGLRKTNYDLISTSFKHDIFGGDWVLMAKTAEKGMEEFTPRIAKAIVGKDMGITVDGAEEYKNEHYIADATSFTLLVPDGAFLHRNMVKYPQMSQKFAKMAEDNDMQLRMSHAFWRQDVPEELEGAAASDVEIYMDNRIEELLKFAKKGKRTEIIFANEAFTKNGWDGSIFYQTFGDKWLVTAYQKLYLAAQEKGLIMGEDVIPIYGDDAIDMPGEKATHVYTELVQLKTDLATELNLLAEQIPLEIMMQSRLHAGGGDKDDRGWDTTGIDNLNVDLIVQNINMFAQLGAVHMGEVDIYGTDDLIIKAKALRTLISAGKKANAWKSISFWNPLWFGEEAVANPGLFHEDYSSTAVYNTVLNEMVA